MKKLSTYSIFLAVVILFLSAGYFLLIRFTSKKLLSANEVLVTLSADRAKFEELGALKRDIQKTFSQKDALSKVFLLNDSAAEFIQSMEVLARDTGLSSKTISVSTEEVAELSLISKEEMLVNLEAIGSYGNIIKYLSLVEILPYKSYIQSLKLSAPGESKSVEEKTVSGWTANFVLKIVKTKQQ